MKLDREYQREMLRRLADDYPEMSPETQEWFIRDLKSEKYITNAQYLIEHGLLSSGVLRFFRARERPLESDSAHPGRTVSIVILTLSF